MMPSITAAKRFRIAVEARDLEGMVALLAPDAVLHSPVTYKPFEGREAIAILLGVLLEVFEDFTYTDEMDGEGLESLLFRAHIGDRHVEGIDIIRTGREGLIEDFTVMVRPMSGVQALAEAVGARLLK
jgi:hypothetical protein